MNSAPTQRKRAVGEEAARLERAIMESIAAAGEAGMLQMDLVAKLNTTDKVVRRLLGILRDPARRRVYIARWKLMSATYCPVFMLGNLQDAPRPEAQPRRGCLYGRSVDAVALATKEIAEAHARWVATWEPHRDPAAAWIGRAAA